MRVYSFHGGIHPPENKKQSTRAEIGRAPIPSHLVIPTQQHIGLAADPIVKVGDQVLKGQLIAEPIGRISTGIHAPTSGRVVEISPQPVPHASGLEAECIIIETDGEDRWIEHQGLDDFRQHARDELVNYIRDKGIAGMGGAGFPTDVKLHLPHDHIINTLVINGAECEPYITADDMLMREHADEVIGGIEVLDYLLQPSHILIGVEDNKPNAIRALTEAIGRSTLDIDLIVVPTKYPSGGERQLIKLLTDVEVPSGKIPADVGIVCQNVGTVSAIHRAVKFGEPVIERIVTVTGDAVLHPQNLYALIGTPFRTLLEHCDLRDDRLSRLVMGGPMMGVTVDNQQIPVIKTTNCLIAATEQEMPPAPPAQPCIRCGMCEQACPAQLLPQQLYWFAKGKEFEKARNHNLFDCIECGACAYVCPSSIPLVHYYRYAKSEIRAEELEQRKSDHARQRFEARQARQEREAQEKAEKRKQRALQAAQAQAEKQQQAEAAQSADAQSPAVDIKALKTAAAVARTKLKKAQDALKNAQSKGLDGLDKLESTVAQLSAKADEAQRAFEAAENQSAPAPEAVEKPASDKIDLKALKQQVSIMRTKLKKAEAARDQAEDPAAADAEIETLKQRMDDAKQAADAADQQLIAQAAEKGIDLKKLRIDAAMAKATVTKAERALAKNEDDQAIESLKQAIEQAQQQADALTQQLSEFE